MPRHSEERTESRRQEIINACQELYKTMGFKDITLKEISTATSFSRPSIYNYFETKEEIFLAILQEEYEKWILALEKIMQENQSLSKKDFAQKLSETLEERRQLLKLMSMNHFDMEENCRMERLVEFKKAYGLSLKKVAECLEKFFPEMNAESRVRFIYSFFPFMYGIYPYAVVSEKQREAMEKADVDFAYKSIYEIAFPAICTLLGA